MEENFRVEVCIPRIIFFSHPWREFGGIYQHIRVSNTIVVVEEKASLEQGARYLRWSFGKTIQRNDLRFGYEMKCLTNTTTSPKSNDPVAFEWTYSNTLCKGNYYPSSGVAIFNFILRNSVVTVTYRIIDEDSKFLKMFTFFKKF